MSAIDEVFAELAAGMPDLPEARCKGRSAIWDEYDDPQLVEYALNQCLGCPVLTDCQAWLDSLRPSQRPTGVCGGILRRPPKPRKPKQVA
jgi:hypothetical protein